MLSPEPVEVIKYYCLEGNPQIFNFTIDQPIEDRKVMLSKIPKHVQKHMAYIIHHYISDEPGDIDDWCNITKDPTSWDNVKDPLYYMANTKDVPFDKWLRCASPDWRLILWSDNTQKYQMIDFNGWPGDNECGIVALVNHNNLITIATNGDQDLTLVAKNPELLNVLIDYEEWRTDDIEYDDCS